MKAAIEMGVAVFQRNSIYKSKHWAKFSHLATVCQFLREQSWKFKFQDRLPAG